MNKRFYIVTFLFLAITLPKVYGMDCSDPDCAACGDHEPCSCSTDCKWVDGHCSGTVCDHACCGVGGGGGESLSMRGTVFVDLNGNSGIDDVVDGQHPYYLKGIACTHYDMCDDEDIEHFLGANRTPVGLPEPVGSVCSDPGDNRFLQVSTFGGDDTPVTVYHGTYVIGIEGADTIWAQNTPIFKFNDIASGTYYIHFEKLRLTDYEVTGFNNHSTSDTASIICGFDNTGTYDRTWVKCTVSGSGNAYVNLGIRPRNDPPICSITGPANLVTGVSEFYDSSGSIDPDGSPLSACDWNPVDGDLPNGSFSGETCTGASYLPPNMYGSETISFSASDGDNSCTPATLDLNIYQCMGFSSIDAPAYWIDPTNTSISIDYSLMGPSGSVDSSLPPTFSYNGGLQDPTCGTIVDGYANPLIWNIDAGAIGQTCRIGGNISLPGSTNPFGVSGCPPTDFHVNQGPLCGDINIYDGPANACTQNDVRLESTASDPDGGPNPNLTYTWSVNCPNSGGNGGLRDGIITPGLNGTARWRWFGGDPVGINGDNCSVSVTVSDGLTSEVCSGANTIPLYYTHNISFDVDYFDVLDHSSLDTSAMCSIAPQTASGVSVSLSEGVGGSYYTDNIMDGVTADPLYTSDPDASSNGIVTFKDIPMPSSDPAEYRYSVAFRDVCTDFMLGCEEVDLVQEYLTLGGNTDELDNFVPVQCGTKNVDLNLREVESQRWITSIDGDVYSSLISFNPSCSGVPDLEPTDGFTPTLVNFREVEEGVTNGELNDAFAHVSGPYSSDYTCSDASRDDPTSKCGKAIEINDYSSWFDNLDIFDIPENAVDIDHIHAVEISRSQVYVITGEELENDFASTSQVDINMDAPGVAVVYVDTDDDIYLTKPVNVLNSHGDPSRKPERLILIANTDIYIDKDIGYSTYGASGYYINAIPNIDMALITKGSIIVQGYGEDTETDNDLALMLRGPVIANDFEVVRDLWYENDLHPVASVVYHQNYLHELSGIIRSQCSTDILGIGLIDVQFYYDK